MAMTDSPERPNLVRKPYPGEITLETLDQDLTRNRIATDEALRRLDEHAVLVQRAIEVERRRLWMMLAGSAVLVVVGWAGLVLQWVAR
jgi:type VI protein secretion system component VasF